MTCTTTGIAAIVLPFIPVFQSYHPLMKGLVLSLIPIIAFTSIATRYLWKAADGQGSLSPIC
ncbi:hypothetical protein R0I01_00480 [Bacillus pumilus]|nr:hypothetical protein R0I01_00480 [Bacillus pumilus]